MRFEPAKNASRSSSYVHAYHQPPHFATRRENGTLVSSGSSSSSLRGRSCILLEGDVVHLEEVGWAGGDEAVVLGAREGRWDSVSPSPEKEKENGDGEVVEDSMARLFLGVTMRTMEMVDAQVDPPATHRA